MDRKEAADLLDNLIGMIEDSGGRDYDTALRMGIEALSAQPERITLTGEERRTLKKMRTLYNGSYAKLLDKLFVSAQPDHSGDVNGKVDLIDRQAAIDVLEERLQANDYSNVALVSELNRSIGYLMQLSSAQPEPDTALYVEGFNDGYKQWKKDAQPDIARDIATIIENEKDMRVILQPEIIRCKDCGYYDPADNDEESDWCHLWGETTEENAFCSYAERKGEKDE